MDDKSEEKEKYFQKLQDFFESHCKTDRNVKKPWSSDRISQVIQQIKNSRVTMQRKTMDYYWVSKYDYMEILGEEILIFKKKSVEDPTIRIVPMEKYYEILTEIHKSVGHGGRLKMTQYVKNKLYIPRKAIEIFVDLCSVCELKRAGPKKGIVTQPIISKDYNIRGQVDLVDLQSAPDGEYKWLMNYQDHATKFLHLRPLKSKRATEVATELLKIFLEFGAPCILQSDNGKEFTAHVLEELVSMWPECKIVHGSPRRPQTQGSVERSNQDVENMLRCWMQDNKCKKWSLGCYFVQYYKNCSHHRIIGRSPYRAMFGSEPKTILKGLTIPGTLMSSIHTEEDLNNITQKEVSITENNEPKVVIISDITLKTVETGNDELINYVVEDEKTNTEVLEGTRLVKQIVNPDISSHNNVPMNIRTSDINTIITVDVENIEEPLSFDSLMCTVCGKGTSGAHSCIACSKPVHYICGVSIGEDEGYGAHVLCSLCQNEQFIVREREQAHRGIKRAAEKMIDDTAKKLPLLEIGNSVVLNVPKIDRGPLDTKNIQGKVVEFKNGVYKIGTSSGTIKNWFQRQELQMSAKDFGEDISELPISLRQAVTYQSMFGGQGFHKCACKPSKNQCHTNRCACYKSKSLCTSKCHHSMSCVNK